MKVKLFQALKNYQRNLMWTSKLLKIENKKERKFKYYLLLKYTNYLIKILIIIINYHLFIILNKKRKQTNNIPQYLGDSYYTNFCEDEILIEINDDESKIEKPVQENSETDREVIQSQEARSNSTITKNCKRNSFVVSEVNELDDVAQRSYEKLMQKNL